MAFLGFPGWGKRETALPYRVSLRESTSHTHTPGADLGLGDHECEIKLKGSRPAGRQESSPERWPQEGPPRANWEKQF